VFPWTRIVFGEHAKKFVKKLNEKIDDGEMITQRKAETFFTGLIELQICLKASRAKFWYNQQLVKSEMNPGRQNDGKTEMMDGRSVPPHSWYLISPSSPVGNR
jgi:hypothetical protein